MDYKKMFHIASALFIAALICMFVLILPAKPAAPAQASNPAVQKAIGEMIDKVLAREVIVDAYFVFIDDVKLVEAITEYNTKTALRIKDSISTADESVVWAYNFKYGTDYRIQDIDALKAMSQRIDKYMLYRNTTYLIFGDVEIAQIIFSDGSGAGAWPTRLERDDEAYYELADSVLKQLVELAQ